MSKKKEETKAKEKVLENDCWMYNKDGARLFKAGEVVPSGYKDKP